jgi:hypothetical protein
MPVGLPHCLDHRVEKTGCRLAGAHGPDGASTGLKSEEAVRQIDFCNLGAGFPAPSGGYKRHLSFHPMHRAGADAECLENNSAGLRLG